MSIELPVEAEPQIVYVPIGEFQTGYGEDVESINVSSIEQVDTDCPSIEIVRVAGTQRFFLPLICTQLIVLKSSVPNLVR